MKLKYVLAGLAGLAAAPASAEVIHETTVTHNEQNIALRYEKKAETTFRQTGVGPRATPMCFWKTTFSVQRIAVGANGQNIPALSGAMEDTTTKRGAMTGLCKAIQVSHAGSFKQTGDDIRSALSDAASSDALALRDSLASLALVGGGSDHQ